MMRAADSPLRVATLPLHHAAEAHPVGASMADGTMPAVWWVDWLSALHEIHMALDPHLDPALHRVAALEQDIAAMNRDGFTAHASPAAIAFTDELVRGVQSYGGGAYVFTGAHLMGGAITERAIGHRLPCAHLRWLDRAAALAAWQPYRSDASLAPSAIAAFGCVGSILSEILARHPQPEAAQ